MINRIKHFALTAWPSVHDEEALTSLELQGRTAAKMNECIDVINQQISIINSELDKLEEYASEAVEESIDNGAISTRMAGLVWENLTLTHQQLIERLDNLILNAAPPEGGAAEIVDARQGYHETYPTLGGHVRAIANGSGFSDAVRPGTVRAGRLTAGMLGADLRNKITVRESIPMAGKWILGNCYYDKDTFERVDHTGYSCSARIPCKYGDTFILESYVFGPLVYPAVILDSGLHVIDVQGTPGNSTWLKINDEIHITTANAAYIMFICGVGQVQDFRVSRVSMKTAPDRESYMSSSPYIHARAKKRTDTVTDRAQIKCWFKLPENRDAAIDYTIPMQLLKYTNLAGWTMRLFGATSDSTYDMQLSQSASAYNYPTSQGLRPYFTVALTTGEGVPITHVCLLIDLYPAREDEFINAYIPLLNLEWEGGSSPGTGYTLHGHVNTDTCNVVKQGAASSPLYGKKVLGLGDSLMAGNTLPKEKSWFNLLAGQMDMLGHNAAVNGQPIGGTDSIASRISTTLDQFPSPDYVILQGGANDLRLGVTLEVFRSALHTIVNTIRADNPRCKILFATNWKRSAYTNGLGLVESDYAAAMMEEAETLRIPFINNYASGIDLTDEKTAAWADEGIVSGGEANIHFSEEANKHIVPSFVAALEGI